MGFANKSRPIPTTIINFRRRRRFIVFHPLVSFVQIFSSKKKRRAFEQNAKQSVILLVICCAGKLNYLERALAENGLEELDVIGVSPSQDEFCVQQAESNPSTRKMYLITLRLVRFGVGYNRADVSLFFPTHL